MRNNDLRKPLRPSEYNQILKKLDELKKDDDDEKKKQLDWEKITKIVGTVLLVPTLILSYCNYRQAEKWKEAEFAGIEFKSFASDSSIQIVNTLLDYNKVSVKLFKEKDSLYTISDNDVKLALLTDQVQSSFTPTQKRIRDLFDYYFDKLSLFEGYAETNLVKHEQMQPYLEYQINIIADTTNRRKDNEFRKILWLYIDEYFPPVKKLCYRFVPYSIDLSGYKPPQPTTISKDTVTD